MNINEELERLLGTEAFRQQTRTVGNSGGDGFESLLTRQLAQGGQPRPVARAGRSSAPGQP